VCGNGGVEGDRGQGHQIHFPSHYEQERAQEYVSCCETNQHRVLTCSAALPKRHSVFRVEIPQASGSLKTVPAAENTGEGDSDSKSLAYEIHGSHFENRATDRATKKFKQRNMSDL